MREHHHTTREAEELEYVEGDELADYLAELAPHIGWVVILFNSLEDTVATCLRELMLHDPNQDERLDVFLAEMLFSAKSRALIHLWGQTIVDCGLKITPQQLVAIEKLLVECGKRRNEYAHADWLGLKQGQIVKVKSQSQKRGIVHRYKRFDAADVQEDVAFIDGARETVYQFHELLLDQLYGRA